MRFFETEADVNAGKRDDFDTPLYSSCHKGHVEVAKMLIEAGADVDKATSDNHATPLIISCEKGNVEVVKVLVANGADVNLSPSDGYRPLDVACYFGYESCLSIRYDHAKTLMINRRERNLTIQNCTCTRRDKQVKRRSRLFMIHFDSASIVANRILTKVHCTCVAHKVLHRRGL